MSYASHSQSPSSFGARTICYEMIDVDEQEQQERQPKQRSTQKSHGSSTRSSQSDSTLKLNEYQQQILACEYVREQQREDEEMAQYGGEEDDDHNDSSSRATPRLQQAMRGVRSIVGFRASRHQFHSLQRKTLFPSLSLLNNETGVLISLKSFSGVWLHIETDEEYLKSLGHDEIMENQFLEEEKRVRVNDKVGQKKKTIATKKSTSKKQKRYCATSLYVEDTENFYSGLPDLLPLYSKSLGYDVGHIVHQNVTQLKAHLREVDKTIGKEKNPNEMDFELYHEGREKEEIVSSSSSSVNDGADRILFSDQVACSGMQ